MLVLYFKRIIQLLPVEGLFLYLHVGNFGGHWTTGTGIDEKLYISGIALAENFHRSVGVVTNPPVHPQIPGFLASKIAVANSLDFAINR